MKVPLTLALAVGLVFTILVLSARPALAGKATAQAATDVNVVNTPSVRIQSLVRIRDQKEPVNIFTSATILNGYTAAVKTAYVVPAGKRLVIETATYRSSSSSLRMAELRFENDVSSQPVAYLPIGTLANGYRTANAPMTLRAEAGMHVVLSFSRTSTTGSETTQATIAGYLEPIY